MSIEYKNQIVFTKNTTIYGHNSVDEGGFPAQAGHGKVSQILALSEAAIVDFLKTSMSIETDSSDNLKYNLSIDGTTVASFTIPPDKFLEEAHYDATTKELVFVFNTNGASEEVKISIADLVDTYTAGQGLSLTGQEFSVKIKSSETRLKNDSGGLYVDMSDILDSLEAEETRAKNAETGLNTKIEAVDAKFDSIQDNIDSASAAATAAANSASEASGYKATAEQKANEAGNAAKRAADSDVSAGEKANEAGNAAKRAADSDVSAGEKATEATNQAKIAERYAKGTENGVAITSGEGFEDNSKYYKELAAAKATEASDSASIAIEKAQEAATKSNEASDSAKEAFQYANDSASSAEKAKELLGETNLNLIKSIEQTKTSTESEGINEITIKQNNGNAYVFVVRNGAEGKQGNSGYGWFSLQLEDATGDLYLVYDSLDYIPTFEFDENTGDLYIVQEVYNVL